MLIVLKCRVFFSTGWFLVTFYVENIYIYIYQRKFKIFFLFFLFFWKLFEKWTYHNSHFLVLSCLVRLVSVCPCLSFTCNYHLLTFAICYPCTPWPSFPCIWLQWHCNALNLKNKNKNTLSIILNFILFYFYLSLFSITSLMMWNDPITLGPLSNELREISQSQ